jgi:DNA polymerase (family 10)
LKNREIAELFYKAAAILEYQQVEWKPRAYKKDAEKIENLGEDIEKLYERRGKDGLIEIPGIGASIADHIAEYLETGKVEKFKKLKGTAPSGASELMEIWGLGAKRLKKIAEAIGIRTLSDLKNAIHAHKIRELKDFGEKKRRKSLKGS